MLYITTRDKKDAHTVHRALTLDRGSEGGLYLPYRMPRVSLEELKSQSFNQTVAELLNQFFSARLTAWDMDFLIGKNPTKLVSMNHRIWIGELWHNQGWSLEWMTRQLLSRILGSREKATDWFRIAVRIALLGGVFGELIHAGAADEEHSVDVAVPAGDFSAVSAVWYAREMGMPIGMMICGSNENSSLWDLFHQGQLHTGAVAVRTALPELDYQVPPALERLIFGALGHEACRSFVEVCRKGGMYKLDEESTALLSSGIHSAVVSTRRVDGIIRNVYRTAGRLMDPVSALAFGALQDYRAGVGETRPALILAEDTPLYHGKLTAAALGMTEADLKKLVQG